MTALLMVAAPFVAAMLGLAVGGRSRRAAAVVAVAGTSVSLVIAAVLLAGQPWLDPANHEAFQGGWQPMPFATLVDGLSATVAAMVAFVALLVQVYSVAYMHDEPRYGSYAAFISLFTSAMLAVVVAGDLLLLVVGWEVMGLCSYLLIGHYWERPEARGAAVKAFLVTKTGDVGFILGVIVLAFTAGTFMIPEAVHRVAEAGGATATTATLLLFLGVMGKSAQFPLHAWLPDAMAGPSPVSALIHAATMVAAGVYVIIRMYPAFLASSATLAVLAVVGSLTMVGAALAAFAQEDLKRVLAWSTVSQLAYMVAALGVGGRAAATFHLLTHAFFKALLFLGAGAVIHAVGSNLMKDMGGLRRAMPVTFWTMTVALGSLAGVPPLAGWFSKESILRSAEEAATGHAPESSVSAWAGWLVLVVGLVTVAVTAAYVVRLWTRTFLGRSRFDGPAHEAPPLMRWPLVVLAVPAAVFGVVGLSASWLPTWMFPTATEAVGWSAYSTGTPGGAPQGATLAVTALDPSLVTVLASLAALLIGGGWSWASWWKTPAADQAERLGTLRPVLEGGYGVDFAYHALAVVPFGWAVRAVRAVDDRVVVPAVQGAGRAAVLAGAAVQRVQRGDVQRYLTAAGTFVAAAVVVMVVTVVI